jgi:hypothetical protein
MKKELLAPNGKPSNLTAEQYKLVRTPEFKKWFGDWENDPKNASKVVDENGEPLVVYHGTNSEFSVFDLEKSSVYGIYGKGFYFTNNKKIAEEYLGGVLNKKSQKSHIKICFLNIKKPYFIDQEITDEEIYFYKQIIKKDKDYDFWFKRMYDNDLPKKWEDGINETLINRNDLLSIKNKLKNQKNNDYISKRNELTRNHVYGILTDNFNTINSKKVINEKLLKKYDGIISEYEGSGLMNIESLFTKHNVYIVFEPNQIKLADGTNTTFDSDNDDIRFEYGGEINLQIDERDKKLRNDKDYFPFEILNEKGEKLGKIDLMYRSDLNGYQISNSNVFEKGKGIGKKAYLKLKQILGKPIISDSSRTEDAENLWKSLERSNDAKYDSNIGKYIIYKKGGIANSGTPDYLKFLIG